jgi:ADP-heptose:LPS heptosyltransferase
MGRYCVLFPGAGAAGRQWPLPNFVEISKRMRVAYGVEIIVCGGPAEFHLGEKMETLLPGIVNTVGRTTLAELVNLIGDATLVVTNETSAAHIAAALGVKAVCMLGGGHEGRFLPYPPEAGLSTVTCVSLKAPCAGCNWTCKFNVPDSSPKPCVANIAVDAVWGEIRNAMTPSWTEQSPA